MKRLIEATEWKRIPIPASAAQGSVDLGIGTVGQGRPVALVTAGVHGDEGPWGALAIRQLLDQTPLDHLRGTLRVVPAANPLAMEADARNAPLDTLDLNRAFPGDARGSHTERLAAALVEHAVRDADVVIDLHGGGSWCVNAFVFQFDGGEHLSRSFDAPFIVKGPDRSVTLTGYARTQGAAVAAVEMGGRSEYEDVWAARIATGLRRALGRAGVLTELPRNTDIGLAQTEVRPSAVLRPSSGGVFLPVLRAASVGTLVEGGTVLGHMLDPITYSVFETFTAPFERTALMLLRPFIARLEGGAMTYVVSEPID